MGVINTTSTSTTVVDSDSSVSIITTSAEQGPPGPRGPAGVVDKTTYGSTKAQIELPATIYRGEAIAANANLSDPVWRIRKITVHPDQLHTVTEWANTGEFTCVWDDYLTYDYISK